MKHYLGALTQFISNIEPRPNLQINPTDSEINPRSILSLNYASKLFPPRSVLHTPHQTDTINIQADIVDIKAPKPAPSPNNSAWLRDKTAVSHFSQLSLQIIPTQTSFTHSASHIYCKHPSRYCKHQSPWASPEVRQRKHEIAKAIPKVR